MATNPIGSGTVNRTVNLPKELDEALGKAVYRYGARSRGEILREALQRYLAEVAKGAGMLVVWLGSALVVAGGVSGTQAQVRRAGGPQAPTVRIVRTLRGVKREGAVL